MFETGKNHSPKREPSKVDNDNSTNQQLTNINPEYPKNQQPFDEIPNDRYEEGYERYVLAQKLETKAFVDKMTGLYNRNAWDDYVKHFDGHRGDMATIIMCDINGLKLINDTPGLGHSAGDILIEDTASFFKETFTRSHDKIFRIGGDEFIICIDNNRTLEEKEKLENFINIKFSRENQAQHNVNFSYGIAHYDSSVDIQGISVLTREKGKTYQTTFDRADQTMYQQKRDA